MIEIILTGLVILALVVLLSATYPTRRKSLTENFDGYIRADKGPAIPNPQSYVPFESSPDPRYVFVPELGIYLLPYEYLDLSQPFDRWMYYTYPQFYAKRGGLSNKYVNNDVYGDNYLFNHYPDAPLNPVAEETSLVTDYPSIPIDTSIYPTARTGFAGGWGSQKFTNALAVNPRTMGGTIEDTSYSTPGRTHQSDYQGRLSSTQTGQTIEHFGHPDNLPFAEPKVYPKLFSTVRIPPDAAFMPSPTMCVDKSKAPPLLELKVQYDNDRSPTIPYTDGLYQASSQYVTDSRATYLDSKPPEPKWYLPKTFDYAPGKIRIRPFDRTSYTDIARNIEPAILVPPKSKYDTNAKGLLATTDSQKQNIIKPCGSDRSVVESFETTYGATHGATYGSTYGMPSHDYQYAYLADIDPVLNCTNPSISNVQQLFPSAEQINAEVNEWNYQPLRPTGSNRLGRGLGQVTEFDARQDAYEAIWDVDVDQNANMDTYSQY